METSQEATRVVERYETAELNSNDAVGAFRESVRTTGDDDLESARKRLVELLGDDDYATKTAATSLLVVLAEERPSVAAGALPALESALDDEFPIDERALTAITHVARHRPDAVSGVVETAGPLLDSDHESILRRATELLAVVSEDSPSRVRPFASDLVDVLLTSDPTGDESRDEFDPVAPDVAPGDGRAAIREQTTTVQHQIRASTSDAAASALQRVAQSSPAAVVEHLTALHQGLSAGTATQRAVLRVYATIAETSPDALDSMVSDLTAVLRETDDSFVNGYAIQTLASLAAADVDVVPAVEEEAGAVVSMLAVDEPFVRGAAANLLSYVAEDRPGSVEPYENELAVALDDKHTFVRGGLAWTFGSLETEGANARLRELNEHDPDPRIRELAGDLLDGE